jgi:hypothetical protein
MLDEPWDNNRLPLGTQERMINRLKSGTFSKLSRAAATISIALLMVSEGTAELSSQKDATSRLIDLINAGDVDSAEEELTRAAIDAGPAAIPALRNILENKPSTDRRHLALGAAFYIGGSGAISIIRREYERAKDEDIKAALATALASEDTPAHRRELIGMLSNNQEDFSTTAAAAFSPGILRANESTARLQSLPKRPNRQESEAANLALQWIRKGYWAVGTTPDSESGRVIAAVLRNGSPNIEEADYVLDESNGGFWKYTSSRWTFSKGDAPDNTSNEPSISSFVGVEGSRAIVTVDMLCGLRCGTGYSFVLRKEDGTWKVQMMLLAWIS